MTTQGYFETCGCAAILLLCASCAGAGRSPGSSAATAPPPTVAAAAPVVPPSASGETRRFTFRYAVRIGPLPAGSVHVFIPVAKTSDRQIVHELTIATPIDGNLEVEEQHGNQFWHGAVVSTEGQSFDLRFDYDVTRIPFQQRGFGMPKEEASASEQEASRQYLAPSPSVPVGDPVLAPIVHEVRRKLGPGQSRAQVARGIFDWVVDNMTYKKVGSGWGHGDTFWACSERYGNCTDFHSLFISLARTESIPARFDIGFPVPMDRSGGEVSGYHCWLNFFLPVIGWVPLDASQAHQYPDRRNQLYGAQPADRLHFTTGRALQLGADQKSGALNYFIYPLVEVDGERFTGAMDTRFSYRHTKAIGFKATVAASVAKPLPI